MLLKAITIACILALACGAPADKGSRIVGGQKASAGQFPHQVSLRRSGSHMCGASILNKRTIVTAAHCKIGSISSLTIVAGSTTLNSGGDTYNIESFVLHEGWNPSTLENDVAVIKVDRDIEFSDAVQPIKLATTNVQGGEGLTASGWGLTSYPGNVPNDLQFLETKALSVDNCNALTGIAFDSQICTLTKRGEGVCSGDSGGPLIKDGELHGIASAAYLCALGKPDFFTRVYSFGSWIEQQAQL